MSPVLAAVVLMMLIVVDQSCSSAPLTADEQRQTDSLQDARPDASIQRRSIRGIRSLQRHTCIIMIYLYRVAPKILGTIFVRLNFIRYQPIFEIVSLLESGENLQ